MIAHARSAIYWSAICIQFGIIMGLMVYSGRQSDRLSLMHAEAGDWEQISETWKRSAGSFALAHGECMQAVRAYQRMVFQPVEMGK
mgnify:CR=1 FL=1